jgi:hypothetical protein
MNAVERAALVGREVLVRYPDGTAHVMTVVDVVSAYGRDRLKVRAANGVGVNVDADRVTIEENGR